MQACFAFAARCSVKPDQERTKLSKISITVEGLGPCSSAHSKPARRRLRVPFRRIAEAQAVHLLMSPEDFSDYTDPYTGTYTHTHTKHPAGLAHPTGRASLDAIQMPCESAPEREATSQADESIVRLRLRY